MNTPQYISILQTRFKSGISREHSYRRDLEELLRHLTKGVDITNEPTNVTDCGNPDFVLTKGKIPIGYIEAKDVGKDLNSKNYKEQFTRYKEALDNLIITDYLWFKFFVNGELVHEIRLGDIVEGKIVPKPENYEFFSDLIQEFVSFVGQTIKSPSKLAKMMASKARLLQDIMERAATSDEESEANTTLKEQYRAFKTILIHELTPKQFADVYAQTLAYGMFSARYQDETLNDFSRQEAAELIPKSNPFLRKLFQYIAGYDIDERILTTVNNLAEVFRATNVREIMHQWGAATQQNDPVIHFYETFLAEYDPKLRKSRGVWYTPEPVVNFMVRAVDDILKTEFGLKDGLADNIKIKVKVNTQVEDKRSPTGYKQAEKDVHKVQILDPATGTGTFLAEIIKQIYNSKFQSMQGVWSSYVENDLIPRLNGFEILMASYAMAHLKLDLLLKETGYQPTKDQRLRVYLTNSLEEYHPDTGTLFANWLSSEANEANHIKRDSPVMVVIGNPPYSGVSSNKGDWIVSLIEDYKYIEGIHFKERKHWLHDDYVKFIRYGQHFINKNGEGILAFINNHSFLDNPTFRGMRYSLLRTFDKVFIIDLHGNSKKGEVCPDGSPDKNVFDIQQGVSINIFIKTGKGKENELGKVFHADLWGTREVKYKQLFNKRLDNLSLKQVKYSSPLYLFIEMDESLLQEYEKGFNISNLFVMQSMGITSARDHFVIDIEKNKLLERIERFCRIDLGDEEIREEYFGHKNSGNYPPGDTRGWKLSKARKKIANNTHNDYLQPISYRPFDKRTIYYSPDMVDWGREEVMKNLLSDNYALCLVKLGRNVDAHNYFITQDITDKSITSSLDNANIFPLYIYPNTDQHSFGPTPKRIPNFHGEIIDKISETLGLPFKSEKDLNLMSFAPIDLLDYIYAILYSQRYREKYKEFLKIDFPRIPYPKDKDTFWQLAWLGSQLRQLHILDSPLLENIFTTYPEGGRNDVTRKITKSSPGYIPTTGHKGRVWINDDQYFDNVPLVAWEFYIGGYQPAQKWLKDRVGRTLSYDDILHYQKIIAVLVETDRIMKEIDEVIEF